MMRVAAGLALLPLAACSAEAPAPDPESLIECALAGAGSFARDCAVERSKEAGSEVLTVRHPDGGFRRFALTGDGRGLVSADGADRALVSPQASSIEVVVGTDRYRFPSSMVSHAGK